MGDNSTMKPAPARRHWLLLAAAMIGVALLGAPAARAQSDGLPGGNWRQYCGNGYMDGNELKAQCRRSNGSYANVEANISSCGGFVSYNPNTGRLSCGNQGGYQGGNDGYGGGYPGGGQNYSDGLPAGNWRQYCTNARMDGNELKAQCRRSNGSFDYVEANISACGGMVSYSVPQTKLYCANQGGFGNQGNYGNQGGYGSMPPGSWSQSCTNATMQGLVLRAQCRNNFGQFSNAQIDTSRCFGGVWNNNGQLNCQ